MPLYTYGCRNGHIFDERAGYDDEEMVCVCGQVAQRWQVYRDQHMIAETGPKDGRKNETPREEKSYRREFKEFQEASQEVDHAYSRIDDPNVKAPNFYKEGVRRARKQGAKVR